MSDLSHESINKAWKQLKILDKLFDTFHNEINEAKQQENYATTLYSIYYWKGYRESTEKALSILLKTIMEMYK